MSKTKPALVSQRELKEFADNDKSVIQGEMLRPLADLIRRLAHTALYYQNERNVDANALVESLKAANGNWQRLYLRVTKDLDRVRVERTSIDREANELRKSLDQAEQTLTELKSLPPRTPKPGETYDCPVTGRKWAWNTSVNHWVDVTDTTSYEPRDSRWVDRTYGVLHLDLPAYAIVDGTVYYDKFGRSWKYSSNKDSWRSICFN